MPGPGQWRKGPLDFPTGGSPGGGRAGEGSMEGKGQEARRKAKGSKRVKWKNGIRSSSVRQNPHMRKYAQVPLKSCLPC